MFPRVKVMSIGIVSFGLILVIFSFKFIFQIMSDKDEMLKNVLTLNIL